jgi:photosystem II stability/assembly factor-like uncharacterized protein
MNIFGYPQKITYRKYFLIENSMKSIEVIEKYVIASIILVSLLGLRSKSGDHDWEWIHPKPQGYLLFDVHFIDNNNVIAVGERGTIMRSEDGGDTWSVHSEYDENKGPFSRVRFIDDIHGWIVGYNGKILKTIDSGHTWENKLSGTSVNLHSIHFPDGETGFAVGDNGTILKSIDAAESWMILQSGTNASLRSVHFIHPDTGWAVGGSSGLVLHTENGGDTWEVCEKVDFGGRPVTEVYFLDSKKGWIAGNAYLYTTTDGGETWSSSLGFVENLGIPYLEYALTAQRIYFQNDQTGYITATHGSVYRTTDGGEIWHRWVTGSQNTSEVFYSIGGGISKLLMVGRMHTMMEYDFGQQSWDSKYGNVAMGNMRRIKMFNDGSAWALGSIGLFHSYNNGDTWEASIGDYRLYGMYFLSPTKAWVVGGFYSYIVGSHGGGRIDGYPLIYRMSDESDQSWDFQRFDQYTDIIFLDIHFVDQNVGFIAGTDGFILKSTDGGTTWEKKQTGVTAHLISIYFVDQNHGWAVGTDGTVLLTTNGGNTWQKIHDADILGNASFQDVFFTNRLTGWVVGNSIVIRTYDGGYTWSKLDDYASEYRNVYFENSNTGWIVDYNGAILSTEDGGDTWHTETVPVSPLVTISYENKGYLYVGGSINGIMKRYSGKVDKDEENGNGEPPLFPETYMLYQNYPNPFNNITTISYDLPVDARVTVIIYDILGREVERLVDGNIEKGHRQVSWDASLFSSGVYMYRIITQDYTSVRKLILMK